MVFTFLFNFDPERSVSSFWISKNCSWRPEMRKIESTKSKTPMSNGSCYLGHIVRDVAVEVIMFQDNIYYVIKFNTFVSSSKFNIVKKKRTIFYLPQFQISFESYQLLCSPTQCLITAWLVSDTKALGSSLMPQLFAWRLSVTATCPQKHVVRANIQAHLAKNCCCWST